MLLLLEVWSGIYKRSSVSGIVFTKIFLHIYFDNRSFLLVFYLNVHSRIIETRNIKFRLALKSHAKNHQNIF